MYFRILFHFKYWTNLLPEDADDPGLPGRSWDSYTWSCFQACGWLNWRICRTGWRGCWGRQQRGYFIVFLNNLKKNRFFEDIFRWIGDKEEDDTKKREVSRSQNSYLEVNDFVIKHSKEYIKGKQKLRKVALESFEILWRLTLSKYQRAGA